MNAATFRFEDAYPSHPGSSLTPLMPIVLSHGDQQMNAMGLLDSGSAVNVLPFAQGLRLGLTWEEQQTPLVLSGNLARFPARGVLVSGSVAHFPPVQLVFAWTKADEVPLILGLANFFLEFDVCFFRARLEFEVKRRLE